MNWGDFIGGALAGYVIGMFIEVWLCHCVLTVTEAEGLLRKARAREAAKQAYKSKMSEP